jgi:hypothetical protein
MVTVEDEFDARRVRLYRFVTLTVMSAGEPMTVDF